MPNKLTAIAEQMMDDIGGDAIAERCLPHLKIQAGATCYEIEEACRKFCGWFDGEVLNHITDEEMKEIERVAFITGDGKRSAIVSLHILMRDKILRQRGMEAALTSPPEYAGLLAERSKNLGHRY